jgi:glycosyltransferase involved in cell wall biosynthesis
MAPLIKAFRVPLVFWYTSGHVDTELRLAHRLADCVVTASPESFRLQSDKTVILGHGIDTTRFCADPENDAQGTGILAVNRIAPDKDLETLLRAVAIVEDAMCRIVGITDERNQEYRAHLDNLVDELGIGERVQFVGPLPYDAMTDQYRACALFVNTSLTGSVDKAVLEAMACEKPILTCNESFERVLGPHATTLTFDQGDFQTLARKANHWLHSGAGTRTHLGRELREIVVQDHDLAGFVDRLLAVFSDVGGIDGATVSA